MYVFPYCYNSWPKFLQLIMKKWLASSLQPASPTISMQEWPWLLVTVSYNGCLLPVASPVTWICLKTQNNQPQVWHSEMLILLFPTCQVRVVRFYASCPASSFSFLLLRRTSTARSRSQCSPANPSSNLWIKVILPDPEQQQWSPPDLHRKLRIGVSPARPQPQRISEDIPDRMPERMSEDKPDRYATKECQRERQIACQNACQNIWQKKMPHRMPEKMSI